MQLPLPWPQTSGQQGMTGPKLDKSNTSQGFLLLGCQSYQGKDKCQLKTLLAGVKRLCVQAPASPLLSLPFCINPPSPS